MKVLMVAEKPSIALALAKILSKGHDLCTRKSGFGTPVHEFQGSFRNNSNVQFCLTSVMGHVYSLDFPNAFNWQVEPRTLFTAPTIKNESNPSSRICQHLQTVSKHVNTLVLWLDCDREGENIGFEVIKNCMPHMDYPKQVYRARFSAITPTDVQKAMKSLGQPNENEARSVDARQEIDLKIGVAFTRYQTKFFNFRYANLDSELISYGPCQMPTLGFCVSRHDEILSFQSVPYYKLQAWILRSGAQTKLKWQHPRILNNRTKALEMLNAIQDTRIAKCIDIKNSTNRISKPIPLNTVALLKTASSNFSIGPQQCMHIAERLYIGGYISYPRTESTAYPQHFDLKEALTMQRKHPLWGSYVSTLMDKIGVQKAKSGIDMGDHPPITPTNIASRDLDLQGSDWLIYEYITLHFISTLSPDAVTQDQSITYNINDQIFTSKGSTLLELGFTEMMHWLRPCEKYMSSCQVGDEFKIIKLNLKEGKTKPPTSITESELISAMEKNGIGTDASISTHIDNIIKRNYVKLDPKCRSLEPTLLGVALVHGYLRIDPELVRPKIRASIEQFISDIALGRAEYEKVIEKSLDTFLAKFDYFVANIHKMDELFQASFSSLADLQVNTRLKPKCGKCNRYMKYIDKKPHRLYCNICMQVYSMPKNGSLKQDGSNISCPLDGFELVVHSNVKGRTIFICPKCYNSPTQLEMDPKAFCAQCPNITCTHKYENYAVEDCCINCDQGMLCLDQINGLRLDCNDCTYWVQLPKNVNKITLSNIQCQNCPSRPKLIHFKYNQIHTPHSDKKLEFDACFRCDPVIAQLCQPKGMAKSIHQDAYKRKKQTTETTVGPKNNPLSQSLVFPLIKPTRMETCLAIHSNAPTFSKRRSRVSSDHTPPITVPKNGAYNLLEFLNCQVPSKTSSFVSKHSIQELSKSQDQSAPSLDSEKESEAQWPIYRAEDYDQELGTTDLDQPQPFKAVNLVSTHLLIKNQTSPSSYSFDHQQSVHRKKSNDHPLQADNNHRLHDSKSIRNNLGKFTSGCRASIPVDHRHCGEPQNSMASGYHALSKPYEDHHVISSSSDRKQVYRPSQNSAKQLIHQPSKEQARKTNPKPSNNVGLSGKHQPVIKHSQSNCLATELNKLVLNHSSSIDGESPYKYPPSEPDLNRYKQRRDNPTSMAVPVQGNQSNSSLDSQTNSTTKINRNRAATEQKFTHQHPRPRQYIQKTKLEGA